MSFGGGSASTNEQYILTMVVRDQELARLNAAILKEEADLRALIASLGTMSTAQLQANASVQQHTAALAALHGQQNALGQSTRQTNQQFLNFGRTLDDLQYVPQQGLRPIINNIMEMSPALGMAMIGVQLLITNWDALSKLWSMGGTKTEAKEMEELGKKTSKTADEIVRLNTLTEKQKNIKASGEVTSQEQDDAAARYEKRAKEAGGSAHIQGEVAASLTDGEDGLSKSIPDKATVPFFQDPEGAIRGKIRSSHEEYLAAKKRAEIAKQRLKEFDKDTRFPEGSNPHAIKTQLALANAEADMKSAREANELARHQVVESITGAARQGLPGAEGALLGRLSPQTRENYEKGSQKHRDQMQVDWEAQQAKEGFETNKELEKQDKEAKQRAKQKVTDLSDARRAGKEFLNRAIVEPLKERHAGIKVEHDRQKKVEDEQKVKDREKLHDAKETGVGKLLTEQFEAVIKSGGDLDAAKRKLGAQLMVRFGEHASKNILNDSIGDARRGVMEDWVKGGKKKNSETIGAADYGRAIRESGNRDATPEKQLAELVRSRIALEKILAIPKPDGGVRPR